MSDRVPELPSNPTPEALKKFVEEATQRTAAVAALTAEINARKGLAAAQDTSKSPLADQLAAVKAAKDLADAKKAQADAERAQAEAAGAAAKARFGDIPKSGYSGTAQLNAGAGQAEALLLGSVAVMNIAARMACSLKADLPEGVTKLLLCTPTTLPDFQALQAFNAQRAGFKLAFDRAERAAPGARRSEMLAAAVPTVGLALDALNSVLGYFKSDFTFQGIEVASTDGMLLAALAGALKARGIPTQVPALYQAAASATVGDIVEPFRWAQQARERVLQLEQALSELDRQIAEALRTPPESPAGADTGSVVLQRQAREAKDALALWKPLADRLEAWTAQLGTSDDKGSVPLSTIVRQAGLRAGLDTDTALAVVQLHKVAGSAYAKRNLLTTLFWFNPFFVMGGAVATMTAFHGKTGEVFSSVLQPWHGEYHSVPDVTFAVNKPLWAAVLQGEKHEHR